MMQVLQLCQNPPTLLETSLVAFTDNSSRVKLHFALYAHSPPHARQQAQAPVCLAYEITLSNGRDLPLAGTGPTVATEIPLHSFLAKLWLHAHVCMALDYGLPSLWTCLGHFYMGCLIHPQASQQCPFLVRLAQH